MDLHDETTDRKGFFSRFEIVPGQHRPNTVRNGAIGLAILAFFVFSGYSRHILFFPKGGKVVSADFQNAANVRGGTDVRIRGVNVGKVDSVDPSGNKAVVKMRIDKDKVKMLRSDAGATIYWRTLLGRNMYVELDPGSAPGKLGNATIPRSRTNSQVEFDQVLTSLDAGARKGFQTFLHSFRQGFGDGQAVHSTLDTLAPAARRIASGVAPLSGTEARDLPNVVKSLSRVTSRLDRNERALSGLIDGAQVTLGVTAARKADIASALDKAPSTMALATTEMAHLTGTLDRLDPLSVKLRPGVRQLPSAVNAINPALNDLKPLLAQLKPLTKDLQPALLRLRSAARAGSPTFKALDPALSRANDKILPYLDSTDKHSGRKVYELVGPTFSALDSLASSFDDKGHDVSFQTGSGLRLLGDLIPCQPLLTDPSQKATLNCQSMNKALAGLSAGRAGKTTVDTGSISKLAPALTSAGAAALPAAATSNLLKLVGSVLGGATAKEGSR
jgi:virulence factor Mce-like protein